jgi:SAM-dependent methyltransferase
VIDADAFNAFEAAGWETKAVGYDRFFGAITSRVIEPLLDAAAVGSGSHVLDVASGPGYVAAAAARRGASVVGLDISSAMVALATKAHPDVDFRQGDVHDLALPDGSFDAVVANFLILHLGRPEQAPAEIPVGPDFFRFSYDAELDALLRDAGLEGRRVQTIAFEHDVATADELWDGFLDATVRTSALILEQDEATRARIREAFRRRAHEYDHQYGLRIPISVKLASGRRSG